MALVFLDNNCFELISSFQKGSTSLPISNSDKQYLCETLGTGYTYLTITTNLGSEVIKVSCIGGLPIAERGINGKQVTGSAGSCLCFKVNKYVLDDYTPQGYCETTVVTENEKYIKITPPQDGECEWKVNLSDELIARLDKCCPEDECDCENNCVLPDGTYENATITIINGKVCGIANGVNIVYTGGSCCNCSDCTNTQP